MPSLHLYNEKKKKFINKIFLKNYETKKRENSRELNNKFYFVRKLRLAPKLIR